MGSRVVPYGSVCYGETDEYVCTLVFAPCPSYIYVYDRIYGAYVEGRKPASSAPKYGSKAPKQPPMGL